MSKIEMTCADLLAILKALSRFASKDAALPHLNQIAIRGPRWMTSNGYAIAWIHTDPAIDGETAIPMSTVSALIAILRAPGVKGARAEFDTDFCEVRIMDAGIRLSWRKPTDAFPPVHGVMKGIAETAPIAHIGIASKYVSQASSMLSDLGFGTMHLDLRGELNAVVFTGSSYGSGVAPRGKKRASIKRASVAVMPVLSATTNEDLGDALSIAAWVAEAEEAAAKAAEESTNGETEAAS